MMQTVHLLNISPQDLSKRIDVFVTEKTGISRSQIQKFIEKGYVLVNSESVKQSYRIKTGDVITLSLPEVETAGIPPVIIPEPIPLEILYKDDYLVVVNKPAHMVVHPAAGHKKGTLINALLYHCKRLATVGEPLRPGVVHRLDKDTSGVMVVALNNVAYYNLIEQFRQRKITRRYIALVYGNLSEDKGEIALKIGRSESDRKKMSTHPKKGKEAITRWRVLERSKNATLVEIRPETGRTHQIRVHFASIGHPVLGDRTYGRKIEITIKAKKISFPRQMLHAQLLGFTHPVTGKYLEFLCTIPEDMAENIKKLGLLQLPLSHYFPHMIDPLSHSKMSEEKHYT